MGKVLFIRGGALGDFILTLPAIELARRSLPGAGIDLLGYPNVTSLAEQAGLADSSRSIEHGPLSLFFVPGAELPDELADYFASYSAVISYLYDPDGHFETNVRRAGVDSYFRGPPRIDESSDPPCPAALQLARPLEQLALFLEQPWVTLDFPPGENVAPFPASPVVAIHPGSGSPRKNWSFEGWIEVARRIRRERPEITFLVISGEAEDRTITEFIALMDGANLPHRHLAHPDLWELANLLRRCSLYLGHDTGVSHLAGASGVASILLFGPTDPAIWAPRNPAVEVIRARGGDLSKIEAEAVAAKALDVISARCSAQSL